MNDRRRLKNVGKKPLPKHQKGRSQGHIIMSIGNLGSGAGSLPFVVYHGSSMLFNLCGVFMFV